MNTVKSTKVRNVLKCCSLSSETLDGKAFHHLIGDHHNSTCRRLSGRFTVDRSCRLGATTVYLSVCMSTPNFWSRVCVLQYMLLPPPSPTHMVCTSCGTHGVLSMSLVFPPKSAPLGNASSMDKFILYFKYQNITTKSAPSTLTSKASTHVCYNPAKVVLSMYIPSACVHTKTGEPLYSESLLLSYSSISHSMFCMMNLTNSW